MDRFTLEFVRHSLVHASEEMGIALQKAAYSPNIRERMDHTCALADEEGRIIGQAEHIPVHIGSLPLGLKNTIRYLQDEGVEVKPGDMYIVNDPYIAGTHLNDVMVVRPIFHRSTLIGYSVNKAHHVDVGGVSPGSISMISKDVYQEGLLLEPMKVMEGDRLRTDVLKLIEEHARTPKTSLGDLRAQVAAALLGERRVLSLVESIGYEEFRECIYALLAEGYELSKEGYESFPSGTTEAEDYLELDDELLKISVRVTVRSDSFHADFSGTVKQVDVPLNAVIGVTMASVCYAVKSAICTDAPLNDGFYKTVTVSAPLGTLVNPTKPAPVAAGNLETSQRIVDAIFKALHELAPGRVPAASSGSMNNVVMGGISDGRRWVFYETIGGGGGARLGKDGESGVHTNMTNTLNTSIEVIERYYPVRILSYRLREGSGGAGAYCGGLGIERSYEALDRIEVTVIGDRTIIPPYGLSGGLPGAVAEYVVRKSDGREERFGSKFTVILERGDVLMVRTAGGGGYGRPKRK